MNQPEPQQPYAGQAQPPYAQAPEPFVPKKRFHMGRLTQILLAVLLLAVGFFGGVGVTKLMDAGHARSGRSQFQNFNGGQFNGGQQGRNRQNGAPTDGASPRTSPSAPATAPASP